VYRSENSELHHAREVGRREQQDLSRENEKLIKRLEGLAKYGHRLATVHSLELIYLGYISLLLDEIRAKILDSEIAKLNFLTKFCTYDGKK